MWQSVVEWLHEHPSRMITIRAGGRPAENSATFTLITRLPDGRKVQSCVTVLDEVMIEPAAGSLIVHEAKMAIECLLNGAFDHPPEAA